MEGRLSQKEKRARPQARFGALNLGCYTRYFTATGFAPSLKQ